MTGESSNDAGGWMYRRKGEMTGACVVCDVVCMSRDITPTQSRVPVFVLTRLCANAEIGVPRGRIAFSRHSCEGRNLNPDMDVLTYTPP